MIQSYSDPDDMSYKALADRARYFKRGKEGQEVMSKAMGGIVEEFVNDEKIEKVECMLNDSELSIEKIEKYLAFPLEVIKRRIICKSHK